MDTLDWVIFGACIAALLIYAALDDWYHNRQGSGK